VGPDEFSIAFPSFNFGELRKLRLAAAEENAPGEFGVVDALARHHMRDAITSANLAEREMLRRWRRRWSLAVPYS
jgi:hypothetical protein